MRKMVLVLMLVAIPAAGWADELKLVKGKGVEVCEAYQESLKGMSLQDMVCGEKADTEDFKRPKWEKLDLKEHKELVKKIEKFFAVGDQFGKLKVIDDEKEFEGYFINHPLKYNLLKKTTVDIANNGKSEIVMLYREPRCDVERNIAYNIPYSRALFVLDEAKNQIDVKKTEPLLQNTTNVNADIFIKSHGLYMLYDIFFHKKAAYFEKWNVDDWTLTIYKQSKGKVKEVCKYKYEQKSLKNKEENGHEN